MVSGCHNAATNGAEPNNWLVIWSWSGLRVVEPEYPANRGGKWFESTAAHRGSFGECALRNGTM